LVAGIDFIKSHRLTWALGISLLLHLLFLLLYGKWGQIRLFPITGSSEEKQIAFEIVENPNSEPMRDRPEEADLYSDRNAVAKDQEDRKMQNTQLPYSGGASPVKNITVQSSEADNPSNQQSQAPSEQSMAERAEQPVVSDRSIQSKPAFNRDQLLGRTGTKNAGSNALAYRQTVSSADNSGGISFNTYDWEFAPYLIELKKRIERNIYPPPAFTYLGLGGSNIVRFRISRDGKMISTEILGSEGSQALIETSKKAVELSAPFWPLPDDFPREFLEVTAKFHYIVNESS
jgi:outer membrane biosynthesis protein TonB